MRQRLAIVAIQQHDVTGLGLLLAQMQTQSDRFDLGRRLAALQRVPRPGIPTRNAASLFTGAGPGATRARSAATPPPA